MDASASTKKTPLVLDDLVPAGSKERPVGAPRSSSDCDLCGQPLAAPPPSSWGSAPTARSPGKVSGKPEPPRSCALCAVEEEFCCRDCYVPWSPKWLFGVDFRQTLGALGYGASQKRTLMAGYAGRRGLAKGATDPRKEGLRLLNRLSCPGAFVCYQCLVEEECGFSVKPHLSAEQKARWDLIEARAESQGGFPALRVLCRRTIEIGPRRHP